MSAKNFFMQEHFRVESFLSFAQELALLCMQISPMLIKKKKQSLLEGFCCENGLT